MPLPFPFCQVCGRQLSVRGFSRNLVRRRDTTYPFRMPDGSRQEGSIRWLCGACERRGERHREDYAATTEQPVSG